MSEELLQTFSYLMIRRVHRIKRKFRPLLTILEGKGAKVGLIVTEGYRQVLQIARSYVPGGLAAWIVWPKPEPMAALEATVEVSGRMDAFGKEIRKVDTAQVEKALRKLKKQKPEAITICLMNSYVNGKHEKLIEKMAKKLFPDVTISVSHEILPEMFEYERTLTTVANAAVRPVVGNYVHNLETELRKMGMEGKLNLLRSDGGLMSATKSQTNPVNLLMSGPAGGVTGALWVAKSAGHKNILTLDVGGTSTDVALIENSQPRLVRDTAVGHLKVRASSLDVKTVGAGGGSIAHVPELTGALRVGPESAGAVPGPACYSKGGEQPTVTDANVVLGYLPEELLGGTFKLDREAAKKSVQTVADALGIDPRSELSRSHSKKRSQTNSSEIAKTLKEMGDHVSKELLVEGAKKKDITVTYQADIRYHGQAFEIPMAISLSGFESKGLEKLCDAFDTEHKRMFTFNMDAEHEVVNLRAVALGKALELPAMKIQKGNGDPKAARMRSTQVYIDGDLKTANIYDRDKLKAGDIIKGPAIIIEMDSTALVHADCTAKVDAYGNIIINPSQAIKSKKKKA